MSYSSEVLADTPVAWYRFQEASGNILDSSGNGRTGDTVSGSPLRLQGAAVRSDSAALSVNVRSATPDWFSIPYNAAFDIGDTMSVECWLKRTDTSTAEMDILVRDQGFFLGLITNQLFIAKTSVAGIAKSTVTITDTTTWHHCVNTKTGATVHQYIDGVDVTGTVTNATYANGTTPTVKIGADAGGSPFNGYLSEVAIYSTVLSQARVLAHYEAGLTARPNPAEFPARHFGPF